MAYASVAQLKSVIPASDLALLTDFDGTGEPSDARLTQALDDASAEINGWIAKVVTRPLPDPPHILAVICRDLAMHRLYANLGHPAETYKALRDSALVTLKAISRGELSIGDASEDAEADIESSPGVAMTEGPERRMTRDSLRGF